MAEYTSIRDPQEDEQDKNNPLEVFAKNVQDVNKTQTETIMTNNLNYMVLDERYTNVIESLKWTVVDAEFTAKYLTRVPRIRLTEYQPTGNQFIESYVSAIKNGAGAVGSKVASFVEGNPKIKEHLDSYGADVNISTADYQKLYKGRSTGNIFTFPFISTFNSNVTNTWGGSESVSDADDTITKLIANASSIAGGGNAPLFGSGVGAVDRMKVWSPSSPASYTFTFELHNTMVDNNDQYSNFLRNYQLVRALKYNNLPERLNSSVLLQPAIYKVEIPGIHYSPASALSNIKIESLGQKDIIKLPVNMSRHPTTGLLYQDPEPLLADMSSIEIPDAYKITITVTDLYVETKELYFSAFSKDNKVEVMFDDEGVQAVGTTIRSV